ncbi:transcription factor IIA subunit alpha, partial [Spiromyces aspiralis]
STVYRHVIDDVIRNVQRDFEDNGVDPSVLEELQRSWEMKVIQSRVAIFPNDKDGGASTSGEGDGGYGGAYSNGTGGRADASGIDASSLVSHPQNAASLAAIINTSDSDAPSAAALASLAQSGNDNLLNDEGISYDDSIHPGSSRPSSYMGENAGYGYSASYGTSPQHREGDDKETGNATADTATPTASSENNSASRNIPQMDGAGDLAEGDDLNKLSLEDAKALWESVKCKRRIAQVDGEADDDYAVGDQQQQQRKEIDDSVINSDLDSEEDYELDDGTDMILCQYDKVTRSKNKWKCILKEGIILVNGRDFLFYKATGDFEW